MSELSGFPTEPLTERQRLSLVRLFPESGNPAVPEGARILGAWPANDPPGTRPCVLVLVLFPAPAPPAEEPQWAP